MTSVERHELIVVGGGVVGLSVAWRAASHGIDVTLLERDRFGHGTSRVAAGMLAPVAEVEFGRAGRGLLELGLRSARLWPGFVERLQADSGSAVQLRRGGTLLLARDEDEAAELDRALAFRESLGLDVQRLLPSAARELEPALAPTLRAALHVPEDHSVDPRALLDALHRACRQAGVDMREHATVRGLQLHERALAGVELSGGESMRAENVVLATGAWSEDLAGLAEEARVPVRPVKGQIMRLRDPQGPGLLERVVRYEGGYIVPRGDGRYVLGATVEERGFELGATAGGVYELLHEAHEILPGIAELEIEELAVGLRPGSPDNVPSIGRGRHRGLIWATGHHRNGILLAPLTAELVLGLLVDSGGAEDGELLELCDPLRFAAAGALAAADVETVA